MEDWLEVYYGSEIFVVLVIELSFFCIYFIFDICFSKSGGIYIGGIRGRLRISWFILFVFLVKFLF